MKYLIRRIFHLLLPVLMMVILLVPVNTHAEQPDQDIEKETLNQARQKLSGGMYDAALNLYESLLQIRLKKYGPNTVPVANVYSNMGGAKIGLKLYDQAIPYLQKADAIYTSTGDAELKRLAGVQQNLAICFNEKGDFEQAETYYENASRIFHKLNVTDSRDYEILQMNLASFYLDNRNGAKAEKVIEEAFSLHSDKSLNFKKWNIKGLIALKKKNFAESIRNFNKAIEVGEQENGKDFMDKEIVYLNLGMVYLEMENFELSLTNYQKAKELIEKNGGTQGISYSSCLKDMGLNYLHKSERESDLANFVASRKKNIETSLEYFQKAIIAITPGFTDPAWDKNPEPENAIDKIRLLDALKNKAEALYMLALLDDKQENTNEKDLSYSLAAFDLSIRTIHLIRNGYQNQESRLFLAENEHPVYSEAIEVASRLYEKTGNRTFFEKGFEISERSRSSDFQTMLRELQAKQFSGMPDSLLQKETDLKGEIAAYENFIFNEGGQPSPDQQKINLWKDKVFSLNQNYQKMIALVEEKYPRYYQYKYADPIVSVEKVQKSLDRREAFLEYFINEDEKTHATELYTFLITSNDFKIIRKPLGQNFDRTVNDFLHFIKDGKVLNTRKSDYIQYTRNARSLYKWLMEPVAATLQNYRLVIVPDDKLSYLPFDAFLASDADTTRMDFRKLDYQVHHHAISYTYSATLLYYYFQNSLKYSNKVAGFAPDYLAGTPVPVPGTESETFQPLPGAEAEVTGLTDLMDGDQYLGKKATKENFKHYAEKYDILHLAMHTMLNDTMPLYSKMVFSDDPSSNTGRTLNTYEIYNLKLRSDMVVLSGCNTGSGKLQKGEGVMSLARAFLYAGCPSIIMTLWNVADASSSVMMIEFYKNIRNGYSKDEALRRSKLAYITNADPMKAHPYFWMGYVSIGKQTPLYKTKLGYFVGLIIFVFLAIALEKWYFKRKKRTNLLK